LAYNIVTASIALGALHFGSHYARTLSKLFHKAHSASGPKEESSETLGKASDSSSQQARHFGLFHMFSIVIGALFYMGALLLYFLGPHSWRHPVTFSLLLGPPGTMLRYALSKLNTGSKLEGKFPIGTFLANMLATAVLAAVYVGQRAPGKDGQTPHLTSTGCDALYALEEGFCGCLSTVSTFASEWTSIKRTRWKWCYVGMSVVLGHLIIMAIVGGVSWSSAGLGPQCIGT
jgi:CrcB protein